MNEVYAHEHPQNSDTPSIFLAGPSPRGNEDYNWRPEALELLRNLGFQGNVYIPLPRDGNWLSDYDAQVEWELQYLEKASVIIFWVPRDIQNLPGFTTNVEFGMFVKSGKIVLGYPKEAPKMRYLEYVAKMNDVPISNSLEETIKMALSKIK